MADFSNFEAQADLLAVHSLKVLVALLLLVLLLVLHRCWLGALCHT